MEYALRETVKLYEKRTVLSLNPCFSGICAASSYAQCIIPFTKIVLILVLVEYALRDEMKTKIGCKAQVVLILVLVEYALRGTFLEPIVKEFTLS